MTLNLDSHKLNWHKDRVNAWLNGERVAPITIDCSLTQACTYRCEYCYGKLQKNYVTTLSEKNILDFLDDAVDIGVKAVSFVSDGESTCHKSWVKAIIHGYNNGLDMALGTNGFLIEPSDLERVMSKLTYIRFNISAADSERYKQIHGVNSDNEYKTVIRNIKYAVFLKRKLNLKCTVGMQMVFLPRYADQIMPLTSLAINLGVDYLVIKHCSDDENGALKVDYDDYFRNIRLLKEAEAMTTPQTQIAIKWSKILSRGERHYDKCYGPIFITQFSGSGLVAPCGMLFNNRYDRFHIGNLTDTRYKDIFNSEKYWQVMQSLSSKEFDPRTMCGSLCLQHKCNEYLYWMSKIYTRTPVPEHINFI